jgi:hypothetical protein
MFLGDIRSSNGAPERVEHYLPSVPDSPLLDPILLDVLEKGRPGDASCDLVVSPLTAYIYRSLGPQGCLEALAARARMLLGQLSARQFLLTLDPAMLRVITQACMRIAISRRPALQQLLDSLPA